MRSIAIAEWILSLTLPPDRAESTVGDLAEDAASRSAMWFWSSVLRTTYAHMTETLMASPLSLIGLSLRMVLETWVFLALLLSGGSYMGLLAWKYFGLGIVYPNGSVQFFPDFQNPFIVIPLGASVSLVMGWVLARRSAGRELPAAFACNMVLLGLHLFAMYASARQMQRMGMPWPNVENTILPMSLLQEMLLMTAAAVAFRYRANLQNLSSGIGTDE